MAVTNRADPAGTVHWRPLTATTTGACVSFWTDTLGPMSRSPWHAEALTAIAAMTTGRPMGLVLTLMCGSPGRTGRIRHLANDHP